MISLLPIRQSLRCCSFTFHSCSLKNQTKSPASYRRYSTTQDTEPYDVIVCGAGMIGTVMACALGRSPYMVGKRVLLLDSGKPIETNILDDPPQYDIRVCAISPGNIQFLKDQGVWQHVPRSQTVERMQVWDACSDSAITFNKTDADDPSPGICDITENVMLISAAMRALTQTNVDIKFNASIVDCEIPSETRDFTKRQPLAKLTLNDGTVLSSKLLIGADGLNSFLAKHLKMPKIGWEYGASAVVATLQLSEPCENNIAWQRFLPTGPISLLPLNNEHSSLVWSTNPEHANSLCECHPEELMMKINDAFWETFTHNQMVSSTHDRVKQLISTILPEHTRVQQYPPTIGNVVGRAMQFPLGLSHTKWYMKSRIAFIGDTIHRIHPLAGQGANMGYRDVRNLVSCIEKSLYEGRDIGNLSSLKNYESRSQFENLPFLFVTDAMHRLYSTDAWPVVLLRSSGLEITNAISPLKDFLMNKAMS